MHLIRAVTTRLLTAVTATISDPEAGIFVNDLDPALRRDLVFVKFLILIEVEDLGFLEGPHISRILNCIEIVNNFVGVRSRVRNNRGIKSIGLDDRDTFCQPLRG